MIIYVYFLSKLYFPAPAMASATKININSMGWDDLIIPSPFAKCIMKAINMVKANTNAVGRVNNPIIINAEPIHSAIVAENPQNEVINVIPILCIAEPVFSQFSGPFNNFGMP
jgi:hypothetical protein